MKTCPLVSVVTPCYNAASYIGETIDSVISQTYTNWEMIVVDDCSTDKSSDVVQMYSQQDKRISLLSTRTNTGSPAIPRNMGIEYAKGKYIALLDADDIWYPNKLSEQISLMESKPCRISYTNGEMMNEDGVVIREIRKAEYVDYRETLKRNELSCSSVMLEKALINDLRFENRPKEDFVFWIRLMKESCEKAYNTNSVLYAYRLVGNSRSRNKINIMKQQWQVLREAAGLSVIDAAYCFTCWALRNTKKYYLK